MHQQTPVAGEQSAIIPTGDLYQLSIFVRGIINNIDPEQAEIANQFSEMSISDKCHDRIGLQSFFSEIRRVYSGWINLDFGISRNQAIKIDRLSVNKD